MIRLPMWLPIGCLFLFFACTSAIAAEPAVEEQVIKVPVKVRDRYNKAIEQDIVVTVFEARGRGPYPLLVLNHGRPTDTAGRMKMGRVRYSDAARYFAQLGFSVWVPTRIGYGVSGTAEDPEYTGNCTMRDYKPGFEVAAEQAIQVVAFASRREGIDARRIVTVGQSFGGATSIALAARAPAGLVAAVNFAGGGGGDPVSRPGEPCLPGQLEDMFRGYGKSARIPTLWIYTENDLFFRPAYTRAWFDAFKAQGGVGDFVLLPAFGGNGHLLFTRGFDIWRPIIENFLKGQGFRDN
ncbi:MAG TPA: alpha/beta fold hydrolase [Burkholderiales bacterium]|nr:alpha/beta fold hydrolase [Burkholderiales bacterium]